MSLSKQGFTLMELLVVLVIVGVIAGLAFPKYSKSVELSHRKDAENQLILIHSAQKMYASRQSNHFYWGPASGATPELKLASINQNLGLNILANGKQYNCVLTNGEAGFTCSAMRVGGSFTVSITEDDISPGINPSCSGSCP